MQIQVTLYNKEGKYRPVSALVRCDAKPTTKQEVKEVRDKGIQKICNKRRWTQRDLLQYQYTTVKMRVYEEG